MDHPATGQRLSRGRSRDGRGAPLPGCTRLYLHGRGLYHHPADYTGTCPYFNIRSKDKYDIRDGLYIQLRVDDFSYKGPDGNADEWVLFSLWDSENIAPGQSGYGDGWFGLIRGEGGGKPATFEDETIIPELDDQGREIYTFEVEWDGSQYSFTMNGVPITKSKTISDKLIKTNAEGEFYVGISIQSTVKDGVASLSILKFGTSEKDATTPVGVDSAEPEPNNNITAPMMDPTAIGVNQPAANSEETTTALGNDVTDAPGTSSTTEASTEPANGGCGSVMGFSLAALITLVGAYLFKKQD